MLAEHIASIALIPKNFFTNFAMVTIINGKTLKKYSRLQRDAKIIINVKLWNIKINPCSEFAAPKEPKTNTTPSLDASIIFEKK